MSVLNDYTADEQLLLMEGPRLGAVVVAAASLGARAKPRPKGSRPPNTCWTAGASTSTTG